MLFLPESPLCEDVFCFTTSIHGGVSKGAYRSFNVGAHVGDNKHRVATNRALLSAIIAQQVSNRNALEDGQDIAPIKWLNQQHSTAVLDYNAIINNTTDTNVNAAVDGIFTDSSHTPLAIMTADCLPIVFACQNSGKIAAVHAGWRGLLDNIIERALRQFAQKESVSVWIGPNISSRNFEVSTDIISQFSAYPEAAQHQPLTGKYKIDLAAIASSVLRAHGVVQIQTSTVCTYDSIHCFSHRRANHHQQAQTGRMATVIIRI